MRIQSQSDTFAWRLASDEFPWRPREWKDPEDRVWNLHEAPLENGHTLQAWSWHDKPEYGWSHVIEDPSRSLFDENRWSGRGGYDYDPHDKATHMHSEEEAKSGIENKYKELYPIGTNTGTHDSGVDYSDLNSFKDYL